MSVLDDIFGTSTDKTRETILLRDIKRDGGTQMRAGLDEPTVLEYADAMRTSAGWGAFPPLVVYYDGSNYWLADGFHRWRAAWEAHGSEYDAPCEVRAGTQRDAMLHAASANADHGLRRTNADKRRAVLALLQDPEWAQWSDGEIARRCKVSQPFVSGMRKEFTPQPNSTIVRLPDAPADWDEDVPTHNGYESTPAPVVRKGADGRAINTANIGKTADTREYAPVWQLENVIREFGYSAEQLRLAARDGNLHWVYGRARDAVDSKSLRWLKSDLIQALNNVAAQMEAKANGTNSPNLGTAGSVPVVTPATDKGPFFTPSANCDFKPSSPWMADWTEKDWAAHDAHKRKLQVEQATVAQPVADAKPMAEWTAEEWAEAEADAERADRNAARREAAIDIVEIYRHVLRTEKQYSELTGVFVDTIPVFEGLRKMIARLESLIEALQ